MLELISNHPFPVGHVWWSVSWSDTVAAIKATWVPATIGAGLINAYGMTVWIKDDADLEIFCSNLLTWSNDGYPTKPEVV